MHNPTDRITHTTSLLHQSWSTGWNEKSICFRSLHTNRNDCNKSPCLPNTDKVPGVGSGSSTEKVVITVSAGTDSRRENCVWGEVNSGGWANSNVSKVVP